MTRIRNWWLVGGLTLGALMIATFWLFQIGWSPLWIYITKFLTIGTCLSLLMLFAKKYLGSRFTYKTAKKIGFSTIFIAALIIGLYNFVHFKWIDPDFQKENVELNIEAMEKAQMDQVEIEERVESTRFWMGPVWLALSKFLSHLFIGLLLAFMNAYIMAETRIITEQDPSLN